MIDCTAPKYFQYNLYYTTMNLYPTYIPDNRSSLATEHCNEMGERMQLDYEVMRNSLIEKLAAEIEFKPVRHEHMKPIWDILSANDTGRSTDFSYGGLLMWANIFNYEFAIVSSTLFIKGQVENDVSTTAFSMPVGHLPLDISVSVLREYCRRNGLTPIFSAVPQQSLDDFLQLNPSRYEMVEDISDYIYDAEKLATLSGKKYGKKRNHVHQFEAAFPDYTTAPLSGDNIEQTIQFMDEIENEGDRTEMAIAERRMNIDVLKDMKEGDTHYLGLCLMDGDRMLAFTIGDIKDDTLFIHIEKALRDAPGAFEMINKLFAAKICSEHPEIRYINREDDAGDIGLRLSKQSYHPTEMLRKYNIYF